MENVVGRAIENGFGRALENGLVQAPENRFGRALKNGFGPKTLFHNEGPLLFQQKTHSHEEWSDIPNFHFLEDG